MAKVTYVVDWTARAIKIDPYPMPAHWGITPYASITVHPANYITVKTQTGTLTDKGVISKLVTESVAIRKKLTPASMKIESLVSYKGILFDDMDRLVTPTFTVTNGMLQCAIDCTGNLVIEYYADVRLFEYSAAVELFPTGGLAITVGLIWAYDDNAPKEITSYQIPIAELKSNEETRIARVYRQVIAADKLYELPTTFTETEISYASYPLADTSELDATMRKDEITEEEIYWDGFMVQWKRKANHWKYPAEDAPSFDDIVWQIQIETPDELSSNLSVLSAIASLREKYGL